MELAVNIGLRGALDINTWNGEVGTLIEISENFYKITYLRMTKMTKE